MCTAGFGRPARSARQVSALADDAELEALAARIDGWLGEQLVSNPVVAAVERGLDGPRSWFVRLTGEEKDVFTVRFRLQQRTLAYETFVMPAPEENQAEFYAHLLRRNRRMYGAAFAIGDEEAIFLQGQLGNREAADLDELDRVLGSVYQWVEQFFRPALRIGFASKFS
jgi:hypothetical protein